MGQSGQIWADRTLKEAMEGPRNGPERARGCQKCSIWVTVTIFMSQEGGGGIFSGGSEGDLCLGLKPHVVQICCVLQWFLQRSGGGPLGRGVGGKVNLPPLKGSITLDQGSADYSL